MNKLIRILVVTLCFSALFGCVMGNRPGVTGSGNDTGGVWEASGVKVEKVALIAAGMLVDLRYRISDAELARKVITNTTEMALIDQASGTILMVPNAARFNKKRLLLIDDKKREYGVLFSNPGQLVKSGSKVTFSTGTLQIKDIVVE